jgi:hypothetical protein
MAITFLQAVNRTLVKLRESEVSTLSGSSDYVKLIAAYVNEVKEEVETAWTWSYLRTSVDMVLVIMLLPEQGKSSSLKAFGI